MNILQEIRFKNKKVCFHLGTKLYFVVEAGLLRIDVNIFFHAYFFEHIKNSLI